MLTEEVIEAAKKNYIWFLEMSVGQACNFKCKNCGNMAPHSPKELMRYDYNDVLRDLKNVLATGCRIRNLQIQGGEPFLYSDLDKILQFAGSQEQIEHVQIATNGSIIPDDDMLQLIKEKNIQIRISDYKVNKKLWGGIEDAEALYKCCQSKGISVRYYVFTSGASQWYYKGLFEMERDGNDQSCMERFASCRNNDCLSLERGRLYYCTRSVNAGIIQNFEEKASDYCIVDDSSEFADRLYEYINNRHFMEACRYCHGTDENFLCLPAEQMGEDE